MLLSGATDSTVNEPCPMVRMLMTSTMGKDCQKASREIQAHLSPAVAVAVQEPLDLQLPHSDLGCSSLPSVLIG